MNVSRKIVEEYLSKKFEKIIFEKEKELQIYNYAYKKYNFNKGIFSDFVSGRKAVEEATDFVLYIMTDSILINYKKDKKITDFFTQKEVDMYDSSKFELSKVQFPLTFKMIQVCSDQWIGAIDVNTFCDLQNAGIINYNPDTQRSMQKIIRNGEEIYKLSLNKIAVAEITTDFLRKSYIPNTITLNIPADDEFADFYYDNDTNTLVINSLKSFDINDGYHRYVAMLQARAKDPDFNYNMELRITNFDVQKSQRMIYQEDQKTKMTKSVSDTYNVYAPQNKVVQRINENSVCNIAGFIGRNDAKIDYATLSECIKRLYFSNNPADSPKTRKKVIEISKELSEDFNILTEYCPEYLDKKYSTDEIFVLIIIFNYYTGKNKMNMIETYKKVLHNLKDICKIKIQISAYSSMNKRITAYIEEEAHV